MSVHAEKIILSDEASKTWAIPPSDYMVLLMRIKGAYRSLDP
jgi:hypothetical protein